MENGSIFIGLDVHKATIAVAVAMEGRSTEFVTTAPLLTRLVQWRITVCSQLTLRYRRRLQPRFWNRVSCD